MDEFGEDMGDITPEDNPLGFHVLDSIRDAEFEDMGVPACDKSSLSSFEKRDSYLDLARGDYWDELLRRPAKKAEAAPVTEDEGPEPFEEVETETSTANPVESVEQAKPPEELSEGFVNTQEELDYEPEEVESDVDPEHSGKQPEVSVETKSSPYPDHSPLDQRVVKPSRQNLHGKPELDREESDKLKEELKKRAAPGLVSPSYSTSDAELTLEAEGTDISTVGNPRVSYFNPFFS
jgi:hypothetical protein